MKLGVITDIHNNAIALERVIEALNKAECDLIVCCGDILGIGPYPEETVQCMMKIPKLLAVRGNHDSYLIEGMEGEECMTLGEAMHHRWEHGQLSEESISFLKGLPKQRDLVIEGYRISILHYSMDERGHYTGIIKSPSIEELHTAFAKNDSDIILYGHEHRRSVLIGEKTFINVGSLGCPSHEGNIARAGILTLEKGHFSIETIDLEYAVEEVLRRIDTLNYPESDNIKKLFYGI